MVFLFGIFVSYLGSVLPESDSAKERGPVISQQIAAKKASEGKKIIADIPNWLIAELVNLGVINNAILNNGNEMAGKNNQKNLSMDIVENEIEDENEIKKRMVGMSGHKFHKKAMKNLKKSFFLYDFLLSQLNESSKLNDEIIKSIEKFKKYKISSDNKTEKRIENEKSNLLHLRSLYQDINLLYISIPIPTKKLLEKILDGNGLINGSIYDYNYNSDDDEIDENVPKTVKKDKESKVSGTKKTAILPPSSSSILLAGKSDKEKEDSVQKSRDKKRTSIDALQDLGEKEKDKNSTSNNAENNVQKNKEKSNKKGKPSLPKCASKECSLSVMTIDSTYCSDVCASTCASELLEAMLIMREKMCEGTWWKMDDSKIGKNEKSMKDFKSVKCDIDGDEFLTDSETVTTSEENNESKDGKIGKNDKSVKSDKNQIDELIGEKDVISVNDKNAFSCRLIDTAEGLEELSGSILRYGLICDWRKGNENTEVCEIVAVKNGVSGTQGEGEKMEIAEEMTEEKIEKEEEVTEEKMEIAEEMKEEKIGKEEEKKEEKVVIAEEMKEEKMEIAEEVTEEKIEKEEEVTEEKVVIAEEIKEEKIEKEEEVTEEKVVIAEEVKEGKMEIEEDKLEVVTAGVIKEEGICVEKESEEKNGDTDNNEVTKNVNDDAESTRDEAGFVERENDIEVEKAKEDERKIVNGELNIEINSKKEEVVSDVDTQQGNENENEVEIVKVETNNTPLSNEEVVADVSTTVSTTVRDSDQMDVVDANTNISSEVTRVNENANDELNKTVTAELKTENTVPSTDFSNTEMEITEMKNPFKNTEVTTTHTSPKLLSGEEKLNNLLSLSHSTQKHGFVKRDFSALQYMTYGLPAAATTLLLRENECGSGTVQIPDHKGPISQVTIILFINLSIYSFTY